MLVTRTYNVRKPVRALSAAAGLAIGLGLAVSGDAWAEDGANTSFAPSVFHSFRDTLKKATPDFDFKIWASDREKALQAYQKGDYRGAHELFKAAADDGDLMASWWLGRMYQLGQGVSLDDAQAYNHFYKVAVTFNGTDRHGPLFRAKLDSLVQVGHYYRVGIESANLLPQPERALRIFRKAAQYRHPGAQFNIGDMMLAGEGTSQRKKRGVRWIMLAARKHYPPAQAKLGDIYWNSEGADNHQIRAFMWYTLATTAAAPEVHPDIHNRYDTLSTLVPETEQERARELALRWSKKYPSPEQIGAAPVPAGSDLRKKDE
ncbi:MAG: tetratricopeptide repeat protein [Hyphomicrobiales bacterium]